MTPHRARKPPRAPSPNAFLDCSAAIAVRMAGLGRNPAWWVGSRWESGLVRLTWQESGLVRRTSSRIALGGDKAGIPTRTMRECISERLRWPILKHHMRNQFMYKLRLCHRPSLCFWTFAILKTTMFMCIYARLLNTTEEGRLLWWGTRSSLGC